MKEKLLKTYEHMLYNVFFKIVPRYNKINFLKKFKVFLPEESKLTD